MKKRALFICTTMYQLLNAVNIRKNMLSSGCSADVILHDSTDFSEAVPRLKKAGIFDNIYLLPEFDYNARHGNSIIVNNHIIDLAMHRIFPEMLLYKRYRIRLAKYDLLFVSNLALLSAAAIYGSLTRKNKNLRLYEYEDGFGTYAKPAYTYDPAYLPEKLLCLLWGRKILCGGNVKSTLLYQPYFSTRRDIPMKKIPALSIDDRELYNFIFGYDKTVISEKYILFNQYFMKDGFNINERRVFSRFMEIAGEDNIIIKMHPRGKADIYGIENVMRSDKKIPWEICMMNQDMDDKVLVTTSSSCVLTSKMIFSSKCKVILLYGIQGGSLNMYDKKWNEFMERFKDYYKEEVFMPRSLEELEKIVNGLSQGI